MSKENIPILNIDQEARWLAVFEAVNIISAHAEKIGKGSKCNNYLKPIHIEKYMKDRYPSILKDLEYERN